jgi:PAS domain S-box-containing protein
MRQNLPITTHEVVLSPEHAIISHTNSKGQIQYVNEHFVEISGFTREELIGQPHNIVRHPDMPSEAFRDMWTTLKAGRPWQGIVKNRCKNGDYYWVRATATPRDDGNFMSVRVRATPDEIRDAQALYDRIKRREPVKLSGGVPVSTSSLGRIAALHRWMSNRSFTAKIMAPVLALTVASGAGVAWQMAGLYTATLEAAGARGGQDLITAAQNARRFYNDNVLQKALNAGLTMSHDYSAPDAVPLPASVMRALGEMSQTGHGESGSVKLFSDKPFTFRAGAQTQLDDFERDAMRYLTANPTGTFARLEERASGPVYRYAKADVMTQQACVACHNNHPDTPKTDWRVGDVRGVIAAEMPLSDLRSAFAGPVVEIAVASAGVLILVMGLLSVLMRQQAREMRDVGRIASDIAHGDLTTDIRVVREDETGQIFHNLLIMRNRLYEIAHAMRQGSQRMTEASDIMLESGHASAAGAEQQRESSASMAAALEQLSASVEHIGQNSESVYRVAEAAGATSHSGAESVRESVRKMQTIAETVMASSDAIEELNAWSERIGEIVTSIKGIADQTNLLALNAAIEAARAGEHGRGFAVVADEVRVLAARTAEATEEINAMVESIRSSTSGAVDKMREGVAHVDEGVQIATAAGDSVADIEVQTAEVVDATHQIQQVLQEQAQAAREVAQTIAHIAQLADANAEQAHGAVSSSQRVHDIANRMRDIASQFKT